MEIVLNNAPEPHFDPHVARTRPPIVHHGTSTCVDSLRLCILSPGAHPDVGRWRAPESFVETRHESEPRLMLGVSRARPRPKVRRHPPLRRHREASPTTFIASIRRFEVADSLNALDADHTATSRVRILPLFTRLVSRDPAGRFQARDERLEQQVQQEHPQARLGGHSRKGKVQARLLRGTRDARVLHLRRHRLVAPPDHQNRHLGRTDVKAKQNREEHRDRGVCVI